MVPKRTELVQSLVGQLGCIFKRFRWEISSNYREKKIYQYRITPFEKQEIEGNRENSFSLCGFDNLYRKKITAFSLFLRYRCLAPNVYLDAIFLSYLCISIVFV